MILSLLTLNLLLAFPAHAIQSNSAIVCASSEGNGATTGNIVQLCDRGSYLPSKTCNEFDLPAAGIAFGMVTTKGEFNCHLQLTDPSAGSTVVQVNELGQASIQDGSAFVGGCGKVSDAIGCNKYVGLL